jgi:thiol-disulfide isomerase/thioredoxin
MRIHSACDAAVMPKLLLLLLTLSLTATQISARESARTVDEALQAAARERVPVLLDFQAQWCYSCYYMASHVLTGPQWQAVEKRTLVTEVDADSPDGARWMKQLGVKALPSYVVLKADGSELGRIVAEQSREQFYPALERILAGSDVLDTLKAKAQHGATAAIADVLASYHARDQIQAGLDWYAALPAARRAATDKDANVALWLDRLKVEKAAKAKNATACIAAAQRVLAGNVGCDRYYVLETLLECSDELPADQRKSLLAPQRPALDKLVSAQVFIEPPACADQRTAIMVSADLDKALGDPAAETVVLDRAVKYAQQRLGNDYAKDRNLADNLRVYLTRGGHTAEVDALMPKLIAAYPDDYVYAYRYGRSLLERKQAAAALPYLEQAASKTFGVNRLMVATLRVQALLALKRHDDAEKVIAEALEENGPWFPEQAQKLKDALKG